MNRQHLWHIPARVHRSNTCNFVSLATASTFPISHTRRARSITDRSDEFRKEGCRTYTQTLIIQLRQLTYRSHCYWNKFGETERKYPRSRIIYTFSSTTLSNKIQPCCQVIKHTAKVSLSSANFKQDFHGIKEKEREVNNLKTTSLRISKLRRPYKNFYKLGPKNNPDIGGTKARQESTKRDEGRPCPAAYAEMSFSLFLFLGRRSCSKRLKTIAFSCLVESAFPLGLYS